MRVKRPIGTVMKLLTRRVPIEAQIIVTRRCNLSCGYCTEYDKTSPFIPFATLKDRLDALHRLGVLNITMLGGEPLMHPELPRVIAYADRRAQVSVTTNGFLLSEPLIGRLNESGLANMQVSIDSLRPDKTRYVQKSLKTMRSKLVLLRRHAKFEVFINLVLCEQTLEDFDETVDEINELGFPVTIGLFHDSRGEIQITGKAYSDVWARHSVGKGPTSFLDEEYGARLLEGERPAWQCRAGSRFLYVDEFGKVQFCSSQRGRLDKPVTEYTAEDIETHGKTYKGCEQGCSLLCVYRDSAIDNQPVQLVRSGLGLAWNTLRARMRGSSTNGRAPGVTVADGAKAAALGNGSQ
jgi:MoaA/NifB/PqqE/SkfB family radical SAM enzyme